MLHLGCVHHDRTARGSGIHCDVNESDFELSPCSVPVNESDFELPVCVVTVNVSDFEMSAHSVVTGESIDGLLVFPASVLETVYALSVSCVSVYPRSNNTITKQIVTKQLHNIKIGK